MAQQNSSPQKCCCRSHFTGQGVQVRGSQNAQTGLEPRGGRVIWNSTHSHHLNSTGFARLARPILHLTTYTCGSSSDLGPGTLPSALQAPLPGHDCEPRASRDVGSWASPASLVLGPCAGFFSGPCPAAAVAYRPAPPLPFPPHRQAAPGQRPVSSSLWANAGPGRGSVSPMSSCPLD